MLEQNINVGRLLIDALYLIEQIREVLSQLIVDKGVLGQLQCRDVQQINNGRRQVGAQEIGRGVPLREHVSEEPVMRVCNGFHVNSRREFC